MRNVKCRVSFRSRGIVLVNVFVNLTQDRSGLTCKIHQFAILILRRYVWMRVKINVIVNCGPVSQLRWDLADSYYFRRDWCVVLLHDQFYSIVCPTWCGRAQCGNCDVVLAVVSIRICVVALTSLRQTEVLYNSSLKVNRNLAWFSFVRVISDWESPFNL